MQSQNCLAQAVTHGVSEGFLFWTVAHFHPGRWNVKLRHFPLCSRVSKILASPLKVSRIRTVYNQTISFPVCISSRSCTFEYLPWLNTQLLLIVLLLLSPNKAQGKEPQFTLRDSYFHHHKNSKDVLLRCSLTLIPHLKFLN